MLRCFSSMREFRRFNSCLLVRSDLLRACEQLLEIRTVTDGIPDRVNLQTSYGNFQARRDGEQTSKSLNGFLRCARTRLDLCEPVLETWTSQSIFFDGERIRRLSRKAQSVGIASEGEVNPR